MPQRYVQTGRPTRSPEHFWRQTDAPSAIDLFGGCGGTSLGLLEAGFDVRTSVEFDPIAAKSYRDIVGVDVLVSDIRRVTGSQLLEAARLRCGECFLLTACAPCQGFSSQRRPKYGATDARNRLIYDAVRLVGEVRPAYFMLENVPGLVHGVGKPIYRRTFARMRKLDYVLDDEQILDAADYGVPQRRERLIAFFRRYDVPHVGLPAPTHVDPKVTAKDDRVDWCTVRQTIEQLRQIVPGEVDAEDPLHAASAHTPKIVQRIEIIPPDGGSRADLPTELMLECHRKHNGHRDVYGRMHWDRPAPTLTGGCHKPSKGRFTHPEQHRGITLREAALLQGFPPTATFAGGREQIAAQIGNAVPPTLVTALALPLVQVYKEIRAAIRDLSVDGLPSAAPLTVAP